MAGTDFEMLLRLPEGVEKVEFTDRRDGLLRGDSSSEVCTCSVHSGDRVAYLGNQGRSGRDAVGGRFPRPETAFASARKFTDALDVGKISTTGLYCLAASFTALSSSTCPTKATQCQET